ncbi:MAG: ribulose-phosphate 3-epimerase [Erysipelotrichaceae bacterium]|nr:ribulose-phosphate 3-epimerase [Erysipelotrichaceae bacterium]
MILAPSILTVKEEERDSVLTELANLGIIYLHLDIMDGKFVPNTTEGVGMLKKINKFDFVFDTHLMVEDPINYIDKFYKAGSDIITFHYEAVKDVLPLIRKIHSLGIKCGVSIKPGTSPEVLLPYLKEIDQVLIMSVEPGFGGQKFMESSLDKIKYFDELRSNNDDYNYLIEVDGGINMDNAPLVRNAGCNVVVMGTALINSNSKKEVIEKVDSL